MSSERQVQYEFKVIVLCDEWAWPHEVRDEMARVLGVNMKHHMELRSVEQVHDGW